MGIHDRDYYREDEGGFFANISRTGQVTKSLIAITVAAFVVQLVTIPRHGAEGSYVDGRLPRAGEGASLPGWTTSASGPVTMLA